MGWLTLVPLGHSAMCWTRQMSHEAGIHMNLLLLRENSPSLVGALERFFNITLVGVRFRIINHPR